jgi:hypothetical protein
MIEGKAESRGKPMESSAFNWKPVEKPSSFPSFPPPIRWKAESRSLPTTTRVSRIHRRGRASARSRRPLSRRNNDQPQEMIMGWGLVLESAEGASNTSPQPMIRIGGLHAVYAKENTRPPRSRSCCATAIGGEPGGGHGEHAGNGAPLSARRGAPACGRCVCAGQ